MGNRELRAALDGLVESDQLRLRADALEAKTLTYLADHYGATTAEPLTLPCAEVFSVNRW